MNNINTYICKVLVIILCMIPINKAFSQSADLENETNGNWVHYILNDGDYLWMGTDAGLSRMNKLTQEITLYNSTNTVLPDDQIISLAKDKDNHIWIGSKRNGVYYFDGKEFKMYSSENSGLKENQYCSAIAVDNQDNKWIGSLLYLNKFDGETWQAWTTPRSEILGVWAILSMKFDNDGVLWLGGLTSGDWSFAKFAEGSIQELYDKGSVRGIEIDDANNKWLATDHGLIKYDGENFTSIEIENLPNNNLMGIQKDKEGNLWMISGEYLIKYDGEHFSTYTISLTEGNNWLTCLEIDDECIWLGTKYDKLVKFEEGTFTPISISHVSTLSNDNSFCIYPNPAKEEISFDLKEGENPCKIEVYNVSGELICSKSFYSVSTTLSALNIYQKGSYLLKVYTSPEKYYVSRLIVAE